MNNDYLKRDPFAELCGLEVLESRPGYARVQVRISENHLNGAGVVHGGLLFTLADFCFGTAVNAYGKVALTINSTISYFVKSTAGILTAETEEMSKSNRLHSFSVNIYNEQKQLLAHFTGMAYNTHKEIER